MKKTIGILGGISHSSTIYYYRKMTDFYYDIHKDYYYPEIRINSLDFQHFTDLENGKEHEEYIDYIVDGIHSLEKSGSDFVIMAANSPHSVFNEVAEAINVPIISIVEIAAQKANSMGLKTVLLTGIKHTMQSTFYKDVFHKYDVEVLTPFIDHQNEINTFIFDELVLDIVKDQTKERMFNILKDYECDGVILGCTELPLLFSHNTSPIPLIDTAALHAEAAINFSLQNN